MSIPLNQKLLFFDGAMGTMLQAAGLPAGDLPELWNLTRPEAITAVHSAHLAAGCDIVTANTFGANALKLAGTGVTVEEVVTAAVTLARNAVAESGRDAYVALDIGPSGKLLRPLGDLEFEDAVSLFARVVRAGEAAGADCVLVETMGDTYELKAAVLAAKENSGLPVFASVTLNEKKKLLTGGDIAAVVALLEGLRADAIGVNCGMGPRELLEAVKELSSLSSTPIFLQPNAGLPAVRDGVTRFDVGPEEFAALMADMPALGACMLGGCCGTTPEHIRALIHACQGKTLIPVTKKDLTLVSSYGKGVRLGNDPVMAGECINPNGGKDMREAIRSRDMEFLLRAALNQQECGAATLDVNVGLPGIDEPALLCDVVRAVQSVCDLPLQLDTSNMEALARASRIYNGKPMINSVNGKPESMHGVFPIMKKYGGTAIALTLDENGIPKTAQGRLDVAKKIIETAAGYGIDKKDLIVDGLAMAVSTGGDNGRAALETLRRARDELGVGTVLGVSNISFGLPSRLHVNQAFMTMAIASGLSVAIINPQLPEMRSAFYASRALMGTDAGCQDYILHYGQQSAPAPKPEESKEMSLFQAVLHGMKERARIAAIQELQTKDALAVIDGILVPALNEVGDGFGQQRLYLPQLLMSAEAAQAAFDVVREHMRAAGTTQESKGRIILATVKGDIHDIGKNIVKALLANYGFEVIDLGKDVPAQRIVAEALDQDVRLIGLSALMTTTVVSMHETITLLREQAPGKLVMVGGAVLTEEYARDIGADFYGADAMSSVRYAQEVFRKM